MYLKLTIPLLSLLLFVGFVYLSLPPGPQLPIAKIEKLERRSIADLSYLRSGPSNKQRVILIHGTPGDATAMADFIANPIPGVEMIALDRPGFGKTLPHEPLLSYKAQAKRISVLLESRQGRWPILVGHSLGGPIASRLAADFPDKVDGLIIVAGSLDPALEKPCWYNHLGTIPPINWFLPDSLQHSNKEIFAALKQTKLLAKVLHKVQAPVIAIHGTKDPLVPYKNVEYMRRVFKTAKSFEIIRLEGVNHFIPWNNARQIRLGVEKLL